MTQNANPEQVEDLAQEQLVVAYLQQHADFLERHPEVLAYLMVPHESGGAISLIERQVDALREQTNTLRAKLNDLVTTAKENEVLNERLHKLSLSASAQCNLDAALDILPEQIKHHFELKLVAIRMADRYGVGHDRPEFSDVSDTQYKQIYARVAHGQSVCDDRLPNQVLSYLFGDEAEQIGSCALIPLHAPDELGVLALAAPDVERFHAELGTLFLDRLGAVVSATLKRLL